MTAPPAGPGTKSTRAVRSGAVVFQAQVLMTAAIGLVSCVALALPGVNLADSRAFLLGVGLLLAAAVVGSTVPWPQLARHWQMALPLMDIAAIVLLRSAAPTSGFGVLLAFPVIWLAISYGRIGTILGPLMSAILLWSQVAADSIGWLPSSYGAQSVTSTTSLSLTMTFISAILWWTDRRLGAQRVLLRRQAAMLEDTLQRTRDQERVLRDVLDTVDFCVVSLDGTGNTLTVNRASLALLDQLRIPSSVPLERLPVYLADGVTPLELSDAPHIRAMRGESVASETYWVGHFGEPRRALQVSAGVLLRRDGAIDRIVLAARDVTVQLRAIKDRDDLVASMSHELRTPLSSILGYVDLTLEDPELAPHNREMLDIALKNTNRLMSLVNDLMLARSPAAESVIRLVLEPTDVVEMVHESVSSLRPVAGDRIVTMSIDAPSDLVARVDLFRLRQVLDNLLSNAIKYNVYGGRIAVRLSTATIDAADDAFELTVDDTGRGMTPEEQNGLFERFYRADSVRGSTIHGTGLGLSIAREIVELHGGTIAVDSEIDRGTLVTVRIPRGDLSDAGDPAIDDRPRAAR